MHSRRLDWTLFSGKNTQVAVALVVSLIVLSAPRWVWAEVRVSAWMPLFKGVELATGNADQKEPHLQQVQIVRIDLKAPNLRFFSTPHSGTRETLGQTTSEFLKQHHLQLAINASYFEPVQETSVPIDILGLSISEGKVVSPPDPDHPALCITADNQVTIAAKVPPDFSTKGIQTAVAGGRMLLVEGRNIAAKYGPSVHPRTAVGLTKDRNTMYWVIVDGRQPGFSVGATDVETGDWLLRLGAYEAIMLDGGGSTALVRDDGTGKPVVLNRPIHGRIPGRERFVGNHLGLFAESLSGKSGK